MKLILHKDTVYETVESEYYTGHQPVEIIKGEPNLSWKGGKIPIDEWNKILAFFKWSYDETHSETQVRLLYNPTENKWAAWAFPQEHGTGMTTKEIDRLVRATTKPYPGAFVLKNKSKLIIWEGKKGKALDGIKIKCIDGYYTATNYQKVSVSK